MLRFTLLECLEITKKYYRNYGLVVNVLHEFGRKHVRHHGFTEQARRLHKNHTTYFELYRETVLDGTFVIKVKYLTTAQ